MLGDRVGKDIFFYSISIDPKRDTPEVMKEYAEKYHAGPGWTVPYRQEGRHRPDQQEAGSLPDPIRMIATATRPLLLGNEADRPVDAQHRPGQPAVPGHHDRRLDEQLEASARTTDATTTELCRQARARHQRQRPLHLRHALRRLPHHWPWRQDRAGPSGRDQGARPRLAGALHLHAGQDAGGKRSHRHGALSRNTKRSTCPTCAWRTWI